jgi:superfamily II DNA or RNA helicase
MFYRNQGRGQGFGRGQAMGRGRGQALGRGGRTPSTKSMAAPSMTPVKFVAKVSPLMFTITDEYRAQVRQHAYIGPKGYTIPKSVLNASDLNFLYKDLYMIPEKQGPSFGPTATDGEADTSAFPVYRENTKKIYLPRFYGIDRYGYPEKEGSETTTKPTAISCTFDKPLRDYQEVVIDSYVYHVRKNPLHTSSGGIIVLKCGGGKCLAIDTPILMYDGTIKPVQDVVVGDQLMGDDSSPRNVLTLARGRETMYKVCTGKGDGYTVNESHILSMRYGTKHKKDTPKGTVLDISVLDYLALPKSFHGRAGKLYGYRVPIIFPEQPQEIDPYLVGYWLGDGSSRSTQITTQDACVIKYLVDCFKTKHKELYLTYTGFQYDYRINSIGGSCSKNPLMKFLRKYDMILNKHIPLHYKCNSRKNQLALLAGIIDSDGHYCDNCYEITQKNERLLDDIVFLARSLGFAAFKKPVQKACTNAKDAEGNLCSKTGTYYLTKIYGSGLEDIPVVCPRKKGQVRKQIKNALNYRIHLEKLPEDDYYGFEIDGNRRFVLGDFTVTHNTVMAIKIVSILAQKTLIIVHKEFLLNQWVERIQEFMPTAKIGRIQGPVFDSAGKDIVIGMLQTLYDRDFPEGAFDDFGLTIVDEVHRIGSCQFSKALLRIQTPYMLGVTATLERKDGLTKVIHHFIGPTVYSDPAGLQSDDGSVLVRGIEFISHDAEFNHVVTDYRGNTQFSTMITKLCSHAPRIQFLVQTLTGLVHETPDAQILVLGHNRCLLVSIHDALVAGNIATVGYYLGGMKQAALEASTEKQIILASYAMASEGFDHKNLSILVMITPKTDIVQSVGRIFRQKHARPLIVDIVDKHETFQNQWRKRRAYYKKCGFRIHLSSNLAPNEHKVVFEPKIKASAKCATIEDDDSNELEDDISTPFGGTCMIQGEDDL